MILKVGRRGFFGYFKSMRGSKSYQESVQKLDEYYGYNSDEERKDNPDQSVFDKEIQDLYDQYPEFKDKFDAKLKEMKKDEGLFDIGKEVQNLSYDDQAGIQKVLLQEQAEETEYDSEIEVT